MWRTKCVQPEEEEKQLEPEFTYLDLFTFRQEPTHLHQKVSA